ncbi:diacylglycerol kinase family protein [Metasolibacillus meyeri]|uniref:Diacylglycerol kinase family protein n=1 Tax=Metasolibacillus meyeri TaxID=1071052 RepID=A0AAW9NVI1_9BACL|nr:diacylglycerol kinase family protein [Metasolibacillus meyeri]MEC1179924.1 diacylglycerol kinase family protein [Metasolibacillus meyeri]
MDIRKFFRSFIYAFQGIVAATKEQNMRFHLASACIVTIAGLLTGLTTLEWLVIVLVIVLVIGAEMINSAIERVVDLATAEIHPLAKAAKDIAAGAVLVFAIGSVIIGVLIFFPKWF